MDSDRIQAERETLEHRQARIEHLLRDRVVSQDMHDGLCRVLDQIHHRLHELADRTEHHAVSR